MRPSFPAPRPRSTHRPQDHGRTGPEDLAHVHAATCGWHWTNGPTIDRAPGPSGPCRGRFPCQAKAMLGARLAHVRGPGSWAEGVAMYDVDRREPRGALCACSPRPRQSSPACRRGPGASVAPRPRLPARLPGWYGRRQARSSGLDCTDRTASKWRRRFRSEGLPGAAPPTHTRRLNELSVSRY
jgi:hypothetical protein